MGRIAGLRGGAVHPFPRIGGATGSCTRGDFVIDPHDQCTVGSGALTGERARAVRPLDFRFNPIIARVLGRHHKLTAEPGFGIAGFPDNARAIEVLACDLNGDGVRLANLEFRRRDDLRTG